MPSWSHISLHYYRSSPIHFFSLISTYYPGKLFAAACSQEHVILPCSSLLRVSTVERTNIWFFFSLLSQKHFFVYKSISGAFFPLHFSPIFCQREELLGVFHCRRFSLTSTILLKSKYSAETYWFQQMCDPLQYRGWQEPAHGANSSEGIFFQVTWSPRTLFHSSFTWCKVGGNEFRRGFEKGEGKNRQLELGQRWCCSSGKTIAELQTEAALICVHVPSLQSLAANFPNPSPGNLSNIPEVKAPTKQKSSGLAGSVRAVHIFCLVFFS